MGWIAMISAALFVALSAGAILAGAFNCGGGTCRGSSGDDTIVGSGVRDVISALNGNDHVDAGGDDLVESAVAWTR